VLVIDERISARSGRKGRRTRARRKLL